MPYDPEGINGDINYELVTCNFAGVCPDGIRRNQCSWRRYLYFECIAAGAVNAEDPVKFVIRTNSLPDHCYYADNNGPIGSDTDFNYY